MKALRTYKLKLTSENPRFSEVSANYIEAFNWLSKIVFNAGTPSTAPVLSNEFYQTIREKFKLPSQVTCSLFRHIVATYRSMKSNQEWSLAVYKKQCVPICWKRDFNISLTKGLSLWGAKTSFVARKKLPAFGWSDSKLKKVNGSWYLCLTVEIEIPEVKTTGSIVGVDSGQKNILTAYDSTGKTLYVDGGILGHRRLCLRQTRAKVASVGTRSAYRLLKRLSGREKSVTQEACHLASKRVVAFAQLVGARSVVMEDLTGIRNSSRKPKAGEKSKLHRKQRARNNRWPFLLTQFFVRYKAAAKGIGFELVDPRYTSQGCPVCGHTEKANRNGLKFRCKVCGFADNADRVGARNIALRSLLQRQASEERAVCQAAYSSHGVQGNSELQAVTL